MRCYILQCYKKTIFNLSKEVHYLFNVTHLKKRSQCLVLFPIICNKCSQHSTLNTSSYDFPGTTPISSNIDSNITTFICCCSDISAALFLSLLELYCCSTAPVIIFKFAAAFCVFECSGPNTRS